MNYLNIFKNYYYYLKKVQYCEMFNPSKSRYKRFRSIQPFQSTTIYFHLFLFSILHIHVVCFIYNAVCLSKLLIRSMWDMSSLCIFNKAHSSLFFERKVLIELNHNSCCDMTAFGVAEITIAIEAAPFIFDHDSLQCQGSRRVQNGYNHCYLKRC